MVTIATLRRSDSRTHKQLAADLEAEGWAGPVPATLLFQRMDHQQAGYALDRCGATREDMEWCRAYGAKVWMYGLTLIPTVAVTVEEMRCAAANQHDAADRRGLQDLRRRAEVLQRSADLVAGRLSLAAAADICTRVNLLAAAVAAWQGRETRDAMKANEATLRDMARECAPSAVAN